MNFSQTNLTTYYGYHLEIITNKLNFEDYEKYHHVYI